MLLQLKVQNYALIDHLEVRPDTGLSVITGETGAGKSILLGALNLLLGQRNLGSKWVAQGDKKCVIEGIFDVSRYNLADFFEKEDLDYSKEAILRREVLWGGKSRAFVNDTPVGLELLRKLSTHLIDIHTQHDTSLLAKVHFQRWVIDLWAGHEDLYVAYKGAFEAYKAAKAHYYALKERSDTQENQQEYVSYQLKELQEANILAEEQEGLEKRVQHLEHRQNSMDACLRARDLLQEGSSSILKQLHELVEALTEWAGEEEALQTLQKRAESARIDLRDIADTCMGTQESEAGAAAEIEGLRARLDLLYALQKKHRVGSCEALLEVQQKMEDAEAAVERQKEAFEASYRHFSSAQVLLQETAEQLSLARQGASVAFSRDVMQHLSALNMPQGRFSIDRIACEYQSDGIDRLVFLFSANAGIEPQPLAQVASGGERSRLMFVIKYLLASKKALPTLIFDEIDTGISGETVKRMLDMVKEVSKAHQVIIISHHPQFAARADTHFFIYKAEQNGRTVSHIRRLEETERIRVLAQMLDGQNPSKQATENARNMRESA